MKTNTPTLVAAAIGYTLVAPMVLLAANVDAPSVEASVVQVFATVRPPDFSKPWTKQAPSEVSGSGVVIEGKRILTCAHVVLYANQVQVQANQAGEKFSATIEAIAPGIDLAILKLDDENFFKTHPPLRRANTLPEVGNAVMAYGYPVGGTSLSITKGIVSRTEFLQYRGFVYGLQIQIDAAINPGNSGGPVVVNNKMIGLAFSSLDGAQNVGYIIPDEEIEFFLQAVAQGHDYQKPFMLDAYLPLENPALRSFLKINPSVRGVVVTKPESDNPAYPLKRWDILTKIGDIPIDNQGKVKLNATLHIDFRYMIQKLAKHGKLPLTVNRAQKEVRLELPLLFKDPGVISEMFGTYPSYFVCGPLVFSRVTAEFTAPLTADLNCMHWLTTDRNPLVMRWGTNQAFEGEELVVVAAPFFSHKLVRGYADPAAQVVKAINGIPVKNLGCLVEILRDSKEEFISIEFDSRFGGLLVFPRKEMLAATGEIMQDNSILNRGSPDVLAIWNAKPTPK